MHSADRETAIRSIISFANFDVHHIDEVLSLVLLKLLRVVFFLFYITHTRGNLSTMQGRVAVMFFLSLVVTPLRIKAQTSGCTNVTSICQLSLSDALTSDLNDTEKCQNVTEALACLKDSGCLTDVNFHIFYARADITLRDHNVTDCDLLSTFYPMETDTCKAGTETCLFQYVNKLVETENLNLQVNVTYEKLCKDLSDFVDCRTGVRECSITQNENKQLATLEEARMKINKCVIPSLVSNLSSLECSQAYKQCLTVDDTATSVTLCMKTREAINCSIELHCLSEVELRILHMNKKIKLNGTNCQTSDLFPFVKPGDDACKEGHQQCLYTYVDNIMARETAMAATQTNLCLDLNTYIKCHLDMNKCTYDLNQLKSITEAEKNRLKISQCEITALSSGTKTAQNLMLIIFVFAISKIAFFDP